MSDFDKSSNPSLPPKLDQSDDLRTRIAKAVCREYFDREDVAWQTWQESFNADPEYWGGYADAVIRELGDLKTLIAEAIYNSEYNLRYHRIDMWGAYQYADAILKALPKDTE